MPTATKKPQASSNRSAIAKAPHAGAKPGYKHTKLGWIPEEWEVNRIGPKIDLLVGYPFESKGYASTGIRLLRCNNIKRGQTSWDAEVTVHWPASNATVKRYELAEGDLVIAMDGSLVGKSYARLSAADLPALLLQRAARIRSKGIDTEYLKHWVGSNHFIRYCDSVKTVTAIPHIGHKDIQDWTIPIPPLSEQRRIAAVLGAWDRAIATTQQLVAAQQQRKQGLIGSALGEVYHHRRKVSVGDIAKEVSERNTEGADPIVLSCSKHRGFVSSLEYFKKQVFSEDRSNYKVIRRGQFGFPANHIEEGSIDLLRAHDVGLVSPIYVVFEFDQAKVNSEFMYYLFKSERYRHIFRTSTNASVDRRGSLRWNDFKNLWVPLPEREEQDRLANLLTGLDRQMEQTQNYLDLLITQKRGLMQQLLTGQTRVKS
ncbi:MAG: restriction endonuclease subunit S [Flavobacteriales bacterium]|nr:restriction endonuclease subunit S [Flavobacteriales bacterium]